MTWYKMKNLTQYYISCKCFCRTIQETSTWWIIWVLITPYSSSTSVLSPTKIWGSRRNRQNCSEEIIYEALNWLTNQNLYVFFQSCTISIIPGKPSSPEISHTKAMHFASDSFGFMSDSCNGEVSSWWIFNYHVEWTCRMHKQAWQEKQHAFKPSTKSLWRKLGLRRANVVVTVHMTCKNCKGLSCIHVFMFFPFRMHLGMFRDHEILLEKNILRQLKLSSFLKTCDATQALRSLIVSQHQGLCPITVVPHTTTLLIGRPVFVCFLLIFRLSLNFLNVCRLSHSYLNARHCLLHPRGCHAATSTPPWTACSETCASSQLLTALPESQ